MIPNTSVLERCQISSIEAFLMKAQFRWTGRVIRMEDDRIPKRTFYGQMTDCTHSTGGQLKRFNDSLKANLKTCHIPPMELESLARDQSHWWASCSGAIAKFEEYAKLPKVQAAATQASIDAGCEGGIDSARTIQLWCLWQDLCFEGGRIGLIGDEIRRIDGSLHHQDRLTYDIDSFKFLCIPIDYGLCCIRELEFAI